ncbi:dihydroneopterin aldolase [Alistipes sp. OttesenSCG-928-B03]|nr:dihydroneopterin aldolase [Alistipes sp. OttesenSCG-928-B03]
MKAIIELENMAFRAFHGCYDLEKIVGNGFLVDVAIEAEVGEAAEDDDLSKSVNYLTVYEIVRAQMEIASNILEHVAKRIADALHAEFPQIGRTTVKVSKLAPPLGGKIEKVSVTVTV